MALEDLGGLIVLEEIQRVPELFLTPRALADDPSAKNRYILSGSVSPELMHQISDSLASRIALVDVSGFPKVFLASSDSVARRWHLDFFLNFPRAGYSSAWIVDTFGSK